MGDLGRTLGRLGEDFGEAFGRLGEEEATKKMQEERRKNQHERSKKREGRSNTKGKKTKSIYTNSRSTAPGGPILARSFASHFTGHFGVEENI